MVKVTFTTNNQKITKEYPAILKRDDSRKQVQSWLTHQNELLSDNKK